MSYKQPTLLSRSYVGAADKPYICWQCLGNFSSRANFNERDPVSLRLFARLLHILGFSVSYGREQTHLFRSPSLPRVNGFYCFFAVMVEYALCQTVIFHPPINSPVGPDFSARNPIARFLPVRNKTAPSHPVLAGTRSPRKSSCHVPFDPDLIHDRAWAFST